MLKRKALWLLLATGIVLQFDCLPEPLSLLSGAGTNLFNTLVARLPANLQPLVHNVLSFFQLV